MQSVIAGATGTEGEGDAAHHAERRRKAPHAVRTRSRSVALGAQLRHQREAVLKLSLRQAAALVRKHDPKRRGITGSAISLIETGKVKTPSFLLVAKICGAYGLDVTAVARRAGYLP